MRPRNAACLVRGSESSAAPVHGRHGEGLQSQEAGKGAAAAEISAPEKACVRRPGEDYMAAVQRSISTETNLALSVWSEATARQVWDTGTCIEAGLTVAHTLLFVSPNIFVGGGSLRSVQIGVGERS